MVDKFKRIIEKVILKQTKVIKFALYSFLLCSPIDALSGEADDLYWWANTYGQLEIVCFQYQTENISKETAVKFYKYIMDSRKNKFFNKTFYDGLIKQFKNPEDKLYDCRDLYEASLE